MPPPPHWLWCLSSCPRGPGLSLLVWTKSLVTLLRGSLVGRFIALMLCIDMHCQIFLTSVQAELCLLQYDTTIGWHGIAHRRIGAQLVLGIGDAIMELTVTEILFFLWTDGNV